MTPVSGLRVHRRTFAARRRGRRRLLVAAGVAALAVAFGLMLHRLPSGHVALWLGAGPALVALGFLVLQGPRWCLAALVAADIFGLFQYSASAGPVELRIPDLFYVALVGWVIVLRARDGARDHALMGQRQLAIWLVALGVSLYPLLVHASGSFEGSLIAWLRLVQTLSLVWLVPYAVRTVADFEFTLGFVGLAATVEVGEAVVQALSGGDFVTRLEGANGPNTTGLLAALIVVLAVHGPVPRRRGLRLGMLVVGVVGLLMTRSLGGTAAVAITLGIYGLRSVRARRNEAKDSLIAPGRLLFLVVGALLVAAVLRPSNLPGSPDFAHSTTVHRAILATAGLEMFAAHPLTGIGWQRSEAEISARDLNAKLHERFGNDVNPEFFPERHPTGVHNAYVQIVAEAGLLGVLTFLLLLFAVLRSLRPVLRALRAHPELLVCTRCALLLLVAIMIWWNDNALYGAQPETVLAATFLGCLAAAPLIANANRAASEAEAVHSR
jgi:O-antigen ligase